MVLAPTFLLARPHGVLVGVALDDARPLDAHVHPDELRAAEAFGARRRRTFIGGRAALRVAARHLGVELPAVLPNARGAPTVPAPLFASVSHKDTLAVALVRVDGCVAVGVDVEDAAPRASDIARHVLTSSEIARLGGVAGMERDLEVVLRFSLKEALYKVLDPFFARYIGFLEVEVDPHDDGTASVRCALREGAVPARLELQWHREGDRFISTALACTEAACAP